MKTMLNVRCEVLSEKIKIENSVKIPARASSHGPACLCDSRQGRNCTLKIDTGKVLNSINTVGSEAKGDRMVGMAKGMRARTLIIMSMAVFLCIFVSSCGLYSVSESREAGAASLAVREPEKKPKLDVPYEPTDYEIAEEMLKMAGVREDDLVYDLGCGDGRIVIMAAKTRGAKGVGVDIDPQRIKESLENARKAGVTDRVRFFQQDLFVTDIKDATVVMLYLWPEVNLRLRPKLLAELKPGARVVSHSHTMGEWKPDKTSEVLKHNLYSWIIPARVTGTWTWLIPAGKRSTHAVLRLNQSFQEVRGTLTIDHSPVPITNAMLTGDQLSFDARSAMDGHTLSMKFYGRIEGNAIHGIMILLRGDKKKEIPWEAKRE